MAWRQTGIANVAALGERSSDAFPNAEVFVQDSTLNSVFVAGFETQGGRNSGPYLILPFDFQRDMGGGAITMFQDSNGSFIGVEDNNMSAPIDVWNDLSISGPP